MQKIEEARDKLQKMECRRVEIEEQLRVAPDEDKDDLLLQYENELDALETQKKLFEDLEFQQLEVTFALAIYFLFFFGKFFFVFFQKKCYWFIVR